jgi:ferrous iron transport protein A
MAAMRLSDMKAGMQGKVISINAGFGMQSRLESMGIRPGVNVLKVSGQFMRGPVLIRVGTTQIAVGFGMAQRVIVEAII